MKVRVARPVALSIGTVFQRIALVSIAYLTREGHVFTTTFCWNCCVSVRAIGADVLFIFAASFHQIEALKVPAAELLLG